MRFASKFKESPHFALDFETGDFPFRREPSVRIRYLEKGEWRETLLESSDETLPLSGLLPTDRSWRAEFYRGQDRWQLGPPPKQLRKSPGLQGPIDDAFMGSFLFVRPTGETPRQQLKDWSEAELARAVEHWRRHFRGHVRIKDDVDVTEEDLQRHHVVLWGDSDSNQLWHRMAGQLPIRLSDGRWQVGDQSFDAHQTAPIMIFPNPLNPDRYLVTNSSFTFREFAYLNNARQVPMLPDWAMIDLTEPAGSVWPGKVIAADFFDEQWQVKLPLPPPVKVAAPAPYVQPAVEPGPEPNLRLNRAEFQRRRYQGDTRRGTWAAHFETCTVERQGNTYPFETHPGKRAKSTTASLWRDQLGRANAQTL